MCMSAGLGILPNMFGKGGGGMGSLGLIPQMLGKGKPTPLSGLGLAGSLLGGQKAPKPADPMGSATPYGSSPPRSLLGG